MKNKLVLATSAILAVAANSAQAQTASAAASAGKDAANLEEIVITGTRRVDRTVIDSASPIDVIAAEDIKTQPTANMLDTVRNLVPSFFVGQNTISDASTFVRAPSLRGLPSDQVLVMMNGKRFNRSALVQVYNGGDTGLSFGSHGSDIGSIPSIGISRLEVLRDGATAQYGSDAIAGVLNFGLRTDDGFEVVARYGQFQDNSDGESIQIGAKYGAHFGNAFINISGEYNDDKQTSRGATRPVAVAFAEENPSLARSLPNYPLPAQIFGNSPNDGYKFLLNSGYDISDTSQIYLFANYATTHSDQSFNFRSSLVGTRPFETTTGEFVDIGGRSFFQQPYYNTRCPANNATCPAGGFVLDDNTFLLNSIYPAGFTPRFVGDIEQMYGTIGYKGTAGSGLRYDLSASLSENSLDLSMYSSIAPSYGQESQTSFEFGKLIQQETNINLDVTYDIEAGLASPVTLSGGAEYRSETYESTEGDPQSYGSGPYAEAHDLYQETSPGVFVATGTQTAVFDPSASGYGGTSPTYAGSNSEDSFGVYVGAEADLTDRLSAGAAVRYEDYEVAGNATVFKLNGIFKILDSLSARATIGTGFHAPSPGQNNTQVLTTNFNAAGQSIQTGTYPVTSNVAQFYGAQPLKPADASNYGFGLVYNPTPNFTATLDWYRIDVSDRIFISRVFSVSAEDIALLPELANVGVGGDVQYFTNSLDTSTDGIDLVMTHVSEIGGGSLNLTLAYNYNDTEVTKFDPDAVSPNQIIDAENLAPHHRANLQAIWSTGSWTVGASPHYYGSWRDETDYPGQTFSAKFTVDADVSYRFLENYSVTVGGSNVFNTYPDKVDATADAPIYIITGGTENGTVYPRNGGPFGINGAFWYARLQAKF